MSKHSPLVGFQFGFAELVSSGYGFQVGLVGPLQKFGSVTAAWAVLASLTLKVALIVNKTLLIKTKIKPRLKKKVGKALRLLNKFLVRFVNIKAS